MGTNLEGFGLTTAKFFYRMPDYLSLLQILTRQFEDTAPEFPELRRYLKWWQNNVDGPLHSVQIVHRQLLSPNEVRVIAKEIRLH